MESAHIGARSITQWKTKQKKKVEQMEKEEQLNRWAREIATQQYNTWDTQIVLGITGAQK